MTSPVTIPVTCRPLSSHFASIVAAAGLVLSSSFLSFDAYRSIILAAEATRPLSSN